MTANSGNKAGGGGKSFKVFGVLVIIVAIGLAVVWLKVVRAGESSTAEMSTFAAERGPLTISVLESGTIKSRDQVIIKNEVEGRTNIIFLIPEGTRVKKGDLLVELDASTMDDDKIEQEIRTMNAEASYINAKEQLEITKSQAISDVNVAELTLEFAVQDLEKYKSGQFPNDETAAQNQIEIAREKLTRDKETLKWSERLFEEKYISQTELQADTLTVSQARNNLELAENEYELLKDYTYHRQIKQLNSDVDQAQMALERTQAKARADVVQAEADFKAKEQEFKRQKARLDKLMDQISKAKLYAPADGMVIYATTARRGGWRDNRQPLDEGVEVYERQELIYLPTADSAMAEVDIHEASLEKVKLGLPAVITVDALPGERFIGTVGRIAPLPDSQSMWMNPDLKVYNSDIYLESESPDLRTGMSCKVNIIVAQYEDAIYVPVQAVIRVKGQPAVYVVKEDGTTEERKVKIGLDDNKMVVIESGLEEGEVVWLTPPLKSASVESGSEGVLGGDSEEQDGSTEELTQQITDKLKAANEAKPAAQAEKDASKGSDANLMEMMRKGIQNLPAEQRQEALKRIQNMTPAQQAQLRKAMQGAAAGGQGRRGRPQPGQGGPQGGRPAGRPRRPQGGSGGGQ